MESTPRSYELFVLKAILSHPREEATAAEIYDYFQKNYEIFRGDNPSWKTSVRKILAKTTVFLKLPIVNKEKAHKYTVTAQWRLENGSPSAKKLQTYQKLKNQEAKPFKYAVTEAILSHPHEQPTIEEITKYLKENTKCLEGVKETHIKLRRHLIARNCFIKHGKKEGTQKWKWAISEEWRQQLIQEGYTLPSNNAGQQSESLAAAPAPLLSLNYEALITAAICNSVHGYATSGEIITFFEKYLKFFKVDASWKTTAIKHLSQRSAFINLKKFGDRNRYTLSNEWKQEIKEGCPFCLVEKLKNPEGPLPKGTIIARYKIHITAAILSHPKEQADCLEIRKFLKKKFEVYKKCAEVGIKIQHHLTVKKYFVQMGRKKIGVHPKWTVTEGWKEQCLLECPKCLMVKLTELWKQSLENEELNTEDADAREFFPYYGKICEVPEENESNSCDALEENPEIMDRTRDALAENSEIMDKTHDALVENPEIVDNGEDEVPSEESFECPPPEKWVIPQYEDMDNLLGEIETTPVEPERDVTPENWALPDYDDMDDVFGSFDSQPAPQKAANGIKIPEKGENHQMDIEGNPDNDRPLYVRSTSYERLEEYFDVDMDREESGDSDIAEITNQPLPSFSDMEDIVTVVLNEIEGQEQFETNGNVVQSNTEENSPTFLDLGDYNSRPAGSSEDVDWDIDESNYSLYLGMDNNRTPANY